MLNKKQLEEKSIVLDWWSGVRIKSRLKEDKSVGIYKKNTKFDEMLLEDKDKLIKRMYGYLLRIKTKDEVVKEAMVQWTRNIRHTIP